MQAVTVLPVARSSSSRLVQDNSDTRSNVPPNMKSTCLISRRFGSRCRRRNSPLCIVPICRKSLDGPPGHSFSVTCTDIIQECVGGTEKCQGSPKNKADKNRRAKSKTASLFNWSLQLFFSPLYKKSPVMMAILNHVYCIFGNPLKA